MPSKLNLLLMVVVVVVVVSVVVVAYYTHQGSAIRDNLTQQSAGIRITAITSAPDVRAVGFYCPELHQALGTRLYSPSVLAVESNYGGGMWRSLCHVSFKYVTQP